MRPLSRQAANLPFLRRLLLSALRLLRHWGFLPSLVDCGVVLPPAHSAAWHVGPALRRPRFVGWPARM